jgi:hypothetical protein
MITIAICICAVLILSFDFAFEYCDSWRERLGFGLLWIFLGLGGGILAGVPIGFLLPSSSELVKIREDNIECLADNSSVSGSFFLGCGNIEGEMKYVFYCRQGDLYRMYQADYDKATIKYSSAPPKVTIYEIRPKDEFKNYFGLGSDWGNKQYEFLIPKGSIRNNFVLDAQ